MMEVTQVEQSIVVFGHKSVYVATRLEGVLAHVVGEPAAGYPPAALTGQHWHWRAHGHPTDERRRQAEALRAQTEIEPQALNDPDPDATDADAYEGIRSASDEWFLLHRDGDGWYVAAERRATPERRSDTAVYLDLLKAAHYVQRRAATAR
jgi:hypothetical protein